MFSPMAVAVTADEITVKNMTVEEAMVIIAEIEAEANGGGTADGLTPAVEDICTKWGYSGKVNGLCNAYCEAMDCDAVAPQASAQACTRVYDRIIGALVGQAFPSCTDTDEDGLPNGIDNCPNHWNQDQSDDDVDGIGNVCDNCPVVANADQADADGNGVGDACQVPDNQCPCAGMTLGTFTWDNTAVADFGVEVPGIIGAGFSTVEDQTDIHATDGTIPGLSPQCQITHYGATEIVRTTIPLINSTQISACFADVRLMLGF